MWGLGRQERAPPLTKSKWTRLAATIVASTTTAALVGWGIYKWRSSVRPRTNNMRPVQRMDTEEEEIKGIARIVISSVQQKSFDQYGEFVLRTRCEEAFASIHIPSLHWVVPPTPQPVQVETPVSLEQEARKGVDDKWLAAIFDDDHVPQQPQQQQQQQQQQQPNMLNENEHSSGRSPLLNNEGCLGHVETVRVLLEAGAEVEHVPEVKVNGGNMGSLVHVAETTSPLEGSILSSSRNSNSHGSQALALQPVLDERVMAPLPLSSTPLPDIAIAEPIVLALQEEEGPSFLRVAADCWDPGFAEAFEIGAPIAKGGMGEISRLFMRDADQQGVVDEFLGHSRGLVIKRALGSDPADGTWTSIVNEIRIFKRFLPSGCHPNVVRFVSGNEHMGSISLEAMSFSFWDLLNDPHKLSLVSSEDMNRLLVSTAEGLQFMHESGVTHSDFKHANVLLGENARSIKLCDFGLSGCSGIEYSRGGTYCFAAPEVVENAVFWQDPDLFLDPVQDIYSFALFWYQAVTRALDIPTSYKELQRHNPVPSLNKEAFTDVRCNRTYYELENEKEPWSEGIKRGKLQENVLYELYEGTRLKMEIPLADNLLSDARCPAFGILQHPAEAKKFMSAMLHTDPDCRLDTHTLLRVLSYPQLCARKSDPAVAIPSAALDLISSLEVDEGTTVDYSEEWFANAAPQSRIMRNGTKRFRQRM